MSDAQSDVAVMADDCTASILESLHQRVVRLEDVWKVGYNIAEFKKPFELILARQTNPSKWSPINILFPALRSVKSYVGEIWVNPQSELGNVTNVEIQKELMTRDTSNGIPCLLIVCLAKINNVNVVLKFRQIDAMSGDSTENEAKHALVIAFDPKLDGMFPKLHCVFRIATLSPGDTVKTWECIGTQMLAELSVGDRTDPYVMHECIGLLRKLHGCGYIHGDPHIRNFMKLSEEGIPKVYMIDQDEIRLLPTNDIAMSNYLQVSDYRTFMFSGNPICDTYAHIHAFYHGDRERLDYYIKMVTLGVFKRLDYFSVVFAPVMFYDYRGAAFEDIRIVLSSRDATKNNVTYFQYLGSINSEFIDRKFASIFSELNILKGANGELNREWEIQRTLRRDTYGANIQYV